MATEHEHIGPCELCGTVDHHLIEGVCPVCRPKCKTLGDVPADPLREVAAAFDRIFGSVSQ